MNLVTRDSEGRLTLEKFRQYGFAGGVALGGLIGVMIAGPHLREWAFIASASTILGCSLGFGVLGYLAISMAYGSSAAGAGFPGDGDDGHSGASEGGSGGGDGGGGSGE